MSESQCSSSLLYHVVSISHYLFSRCEQQGALFALNALGAAIGPLSMQAIYDKTKNNLGPGTMFFFASFLYATGTVFVSCIPSKKEVIAVAEAENIGTETDLEEPLIGK